MNYPQITQITQIKKKKREKKGYRYCLSNLCNLRYLWIVFLR
jgi:hypothetical protein